MYNSPVLALCEENDGRSDQCYYDNYNQLSDKRGVATFDDYDKMVQNCRGKGGGWFGGGADEGSCSNAVSGCIREAVNMNDCSDGDLMAKQAGCNGGNVDNCLGILNSNEFWDARNAAIDSATKNCTLIPGQEAKNKADCENAAKDVAVACEKQFQKSTRANFASRTQCLADEIAKKAKDEKECTGRKGRWVQNGSGGGTCEPPSKIPELDCSANKGNWNATTKNCDDTEDWCKARGGTWSGSKCDKATPKTNGSTGTPSSAGPANPPTNTGVCGSARTVLIPSGKTGDEIDGCKPDQDGKGGMDALIGIVKFVVSILNIGVGVVAVGGIVYASILYASARDTASQTQQAIGIIRNVVVGLLLYIFMVAILNWLLPGSVLQ